MEILRILWPNEHGLTIREVCRGLGSAADEEDEGPAYSSVQTRLGLMENKGLVRKDGTIRPAKYYAAVTEQGAQRHVFRELLDRFFHGSAAKLILHALRSKDISAEEREAISQRLKDLKKKST